MATAVGAQIDHAVDRATGSKPPATPTDAGGPPEALSYSLDEALTLLAALEDARDGLIDSRHLAEVVSVETEIRVLSRKLGFDDPEGGTDVR